MSALDSVPVLLMVSAYARDKLVQQPESSAAQAILIKPVMPSAIESTLNSLPQEPVGAAPESEEATPPSPNGLQGVHLLLVEDNPLNQIVARGLLQKAGATLDLAENGEKAVEMLRQNPQAYRLVLMDVQMPVMDGFAATRIIRDELKLELPILAMSAGVLVSEQEECASSGMNDFIPKPIDYAQMLSVIQKYLVD